MDRTIVQDYETQRGDESPPLRHSAYVHMDSLLGHRSLGIIRFDMRLGDARAVQDRNLRAVVVLAGVDDVPNRRDGREAREHHRGVVHRLGRDGDGGRCC